MADGNGIACPRCGSLDSEVTDSRPSGDGRRRRRECGLCSRRFSTMELRSDDLYELFAALDALSDTWRMKAPRDELGGDG